jgi:hypothetical protein
VSEIVDAYFTDNRIDFPDEHRCALQRARRIAANIARLPELLGKAERD